MEEGTVYTLLLSVCAASIFDFFITIMPREHQKHKNASVFVQTLDRLIEVKRAQYISIEYLSNPLTQIPHIPSTDPALNRAKAITLKRLIKSNQAKTANHSYLSADITGLVHHNTNHDLFRWAEDYFTGELSLLLSEVDSDLFPSFHYLIRRISIERNNAMRLPVPGDHGIERYITHQFKCIETLELYFMLHCQRYIEPLRRGWGPALYYDRESLSAMLTTQMQYFDFREPSSSQ